VRVYVVLSGLVVGCAGDPETDHPDQNGNLSEEVGGQDSSDGWEAGDGGQPAVVSVYPSEPQLEYDSSSASDDTGSADVPIEEPFVPDWPEGTDPFADAIVSFEPGPDAGHGWDDALDIVLGWPEGRGATAGSLDVLSLGERGVVVIEMTDLSIYDGPGPDFIVFENAFSGWLETGTVAVSADGEEWLEWVCEADNAEDGFPGCAGVGYVYADSTGMIDPTDPEVAGGDAFDLADLGIEEVRFVRVQDSGFNDWAYGGTTGGFDLDAVAAVNWRQLTAFD